MSPPYGHLLLPILFYGWCESRLEFVWSAFVFNYAQPNAVGLELAKGSLKFVAKTLLVVIFFLAVISR